MRPQNKNPKQIAVYIVQWCDNDDSDDDDDV